MRKGRLVPVTDNNVTFKITGAGSLIGMGNGDPTDHDPDKGSSRKAFGGVCMAIVQSTKSTGSISVKATSPGLSSASVTIDAKEVKLRQQVAPWERAAPKGSGATGLWRPQQDSASQIFILRQDGNTLTGTAEGVSGDWAGGVDAPAPILDGKVDGSSVSFKVGNATYAGTLKGDHIELVRTPVPGPQRPKAEEKTAEPRPAIGPAPDGSDPSRSPFYHPPALSRWCCNGSSANPLAQSRRRVHPSPPPALHRGKSLIKRLLWPGLVSVRVPIRYCSSARLNRRSQSSLTPAF